MSDTAASTATGEQELVMLRQLLGAPLLSPAGERLGRIEDLIVKLDEGGYPPVTGFKASIGGRDLFVGSELIDKLGDVGYSYERKGRRRSKRVAFYLFEYRSGDLADHDDEIEDARWMPLQEAARSLTYAGEREMVTRALSRLAADR